MSITGGLALGLGLGLTGSRGAATSNPTPLNANLLKADLDGKVLVLHDSQSVASNIRFGAQLPLVLGEFSRTLMGFQIPARVIFSAGSNVTAPVVAGVTRTELIPAENWPSTGDASTDHWQQSCEFANGASDLANFTDLMMMTADSSFFDAFDMSGPMAFRAGFLNHATSFERVSLWEQRGATTGFNANYGNGGTGQTPSGEMEWIEDGKVVYVGKGIRSTAFMPGGSSQVGVFIKTSAADETSKQLRLLGGIVYKSGGPGGAPDNTFLTTSQSMFCYIGRGGWTAHDLTTKISDNALDAMIRMAEGFKTVIIPLGHNAEYTGTYKGNLETLANRAISRHTALGFSAPKIILCPTWAFTGQEARMAAQADDAYDLALSEDWGFVNLYKTYNGLNPADNAKRIDGTAATYNMDAGSKLHPTDSATAKNIARDFYEHFEDDFRVD